MMSGLPRTEEIDLWLRQHANGGSDADASSENP
jgi:hypothetical protein